MKDGYIKIYRTMFEHWLWSEKPFSKAQAWIDLLQMANIKDSKTLIKGKVIEVKRGQVLRAIGTLADRWGWSEKKVRSFIRLLEGQEMVQAEGIPQGTLITIEKYALYNTLGQERDSAEDRAEGEQRASRGRGNKKERKKERKNNKEGASDWIADIVPAELRDVFTEWADMRKAQKKAIPSRASVQRAYNQLTKLSTNVSVQRQIVEQSTDRCWASFYELKDKPRRAYQEFPKEKPVQAVPMTEEQKRNRDKIMQELKGIF